MREIDVRGMLEEFGDAALRELDYRGEAFNAHLLGKNLSEIPGVQVPAVYPQLSSSRILTQQFIHGVKVTDVEALDAAGLNREQLAGAYLRSAIKQLMIDGVFHGDPHPGNVLVDLDSGMITYIDLGMLGRMTVYQRINMGRLLLAIQQRNTYSLANVLRSVSTAEGEVESSAYYTDFESRIGRYWMSDVNPDFGPVMNEMFDLLAQHGLVLDTQLTLAVKVLMQSDAISKRLFPAGELVPMAVDLLREQLAGAVTVESITDYLMRELTQVAGEVIQRLPTLEQATLKWLDQYERGQLSLKLDTSQLDETVHGLKGVSVQILVGLMLVGMIIGSAIAATAPTLSGRYWQLVPRLATGGYVFAMFVAGYLVLRLLWRVLRGD
jgi:ubiquinone biosynthesis protein